MDNLKNGTSPELKDSSISEKQLLGEGELIAENTCKKNGCFVLLFVFLGLSAILVPYIVAINRGHVTPILPFISEAGGSPPQNGVFSILLYLLALTGVLLMVIRYYSVMYHSSSNNWKLKWSNRLGLATGLLTAFGLVLTGAYPVNMTHQKENWEHTTLVPHVVGATTVFVGGTAYIFWQTVITLFFIRHHKFLFVIRLFLFLLCIATFLPCNVSFLEVVKEMKPNNFLQVLNRTMNGTILQEQIHKEVSYSSQYFICSISEWVLTISLLLYVASFFKDVHSISLRVTYNFLSRKESPVKPKLEELGAD